MDQLKPINFFVLKCFLMFSMGLSGQSVPRLEAFKTYVPTFTTYQEQMEGKVETEYIGIAINKIKGNTHIENWELRVRTLGNYVNQSTSGVTIAPQFTSLQFNNVDQSGMAPTNMGNIPLSTSETVLLSGALPLDPETSGYYLQYKFDYILQGGNHLLVDNGNYRVPLMFSLYDGNNQLLDSFVLNDVGFQIQTGGYEISNTLVLQNAALITFTFDEVSDYLNGLSIYKNNALKVEYNGAYEVIVKANSNQLTSATTSNTIPVSLFKIEVSQTQENLPNLVLTPSIALSTNDPVMIKNPHPYINNDAYGTVEYNLRYFIPPNNTKNIFGPAASYTTEIYFVVLPL